MADLAVSPLSLAQKSPSWADAVRSGIPSAGSADREGVWEMEGYYKTTLDNLQVVIVFQEYTLNEIEPRLEHSFPQWSCAVSHSRIDEKNRSQEGNKHMAANFTLRVLVTCVEAIT